MTVEKRAAEHELLGEVRKQRTELRAAMSIVERALARPVSGDGAPWEEHLRDAVLELSAAFEEHVTVTEGPDGLYQDLQQVAPRLCGVVARLTAEHRTIAGRIDGLLAQLGRVQSPGDAEQVRDLGTALLDTLMRHRQRGSDLVYEAYATDIGGET
jgi:hypothetical protein